MDGFLARTKKWQGRLRRVVARVQTKKDRSARFLCLNCRGVGHKVSDCRDESVLSTADDIAWCCSSQRDEVNILLECEAVPEALCQRCVDLDLPAWLDTSPAFETNEGLTDAYEANDERIFRRLGVVGDVELHSDCDLCLCIFGLIPTPSSPTQTIVLALSWTLHRLENGLSLDTAAKRATSRCVSAVLEPLAAGEEIHNTISTYGDALALAQANLGDSESGLGTAPVNPFVVNGEKIQRWLALCQEKHPSTCSRLRSSKLDTIRLIDADTRTIVPYASNTKDYLALSYVWGGVDQCVPGAGSPGTELPRLPRTIDDALFLTKQLGHRYLWVDSICIDQADAHDKDAQIQAMREIYQGSFATIVAVSAVDANSGLPRVARTTSPYRQLSCTAQGRRLFTLGPTLEALLWTVPWASRAWTYQEALLSPRCIYVSNYQVYFECNSMTCCESLDESRSAVHQQQMDEDYLRTETYTKQLNLGELRNPITKAITSREKGLNVYSLLSSAYSRRQMKYERDALSAFSGILQAFERTVYREGFFWALPCAHINWAMAWQPHDPESATRPQFPTWSWLSNAGGMWPGGPAIGRSADDPDRHQFDLKLSKHDEAKGLQAIFSWSGKVMTEEERQELANDPLADPTAFELLGSFELPSSLGHSELDKVLFFEGFVLEFAIEERWEVDGNEDHSLCRIGNGESRLNGITTYDPRPLRSRVQLWLLLTRHIDDDVVYNLIALKPEDGCYERAGFLRLVVPKSKHALLKEFDLHRLKGVLL